MQVIKTFLPLILSLLISCQHEVRKNNMLSIKTNEKPGTVIILNGPSASGKSSIQRKVQEHFKDPYIRVGVDNLFSDILPDYYGMGQVVPKGDFLEKDVRYVENIKVDQKNAVKLIVGPIGQKVINGMHYSIASYARTGNNVVVDYILYDKEWFAELVKALKGVKVYYIGIQYPIEVIEERERKRATSPVGHARSHYKTVHAFDNYDLVINNPKFSAEKIALTIKKYIKDNPNPKSFKDYLDILNSNQ